MRARWNGARGERRGVMDGEHTIAASGSHAPRRWSFWSGVLSRQVLQHEVLSRLRTVTGVLYFEPAARTSWARPRKMRLTACVAC